MPIRPEITGQAIKPLGVSIKQAAEITGQSEWTIKQKLRAKVYKAKKAGRRTLVDYESIEAAWKALPDATFKAPTPRKRRRADNNATPMSE
jgi:hypothetical protein